MEAPDYHKEHTKRIQSSKKKWLRRSWISNAIKFSIPPILLGGYSRYESTWLEITKTVVRLPFLPSQKKIKILHLSDLHLSQATSINYIKHSFAEGLKEKPHACMITGDFITDRPNDEQLDALKNCLAKISKKVPTFASLGNHDGGTWAAARSGFSSPEKIKNVLKAAKVRILHNERANTYLNGLPVTVTGLGDMWNTECLPRKCMARIGSDQRRRPHLNILLSHNPDTKNLVNEYDWALMLSGHTHGGQFRIPFSNYAPLAPVSDLSHTEGLQDFHGRPHFITRGIGSLYGVRVNCRPEASILELSRS
jgi:uncharacterized protein